MGTTSSSIFNGTSRYSQDFQSAIDRSVAIASMPITQMSSDEVSLNSQSTALTALESGFSALQTAIQDIEGAIGSSGFTATVSDSTKLNVTLGEGAVEGNYTVDIANPGAYATSLTAKSWSADAGAVHTYQLSIGGVDYTLSPASNSADNVAAAINSSYGGKVHAAVVNLGSTTGADDYRISLQSTLLDDLRPEILVGVQGGFTGDADSQATSQTAKTWVADAGAAHTYRLSVDGKSYAVTPVDNTAQSVVSAINTQQGDKVTATLVNLGDVANPDYRISLTTVAKGNLRPEITVGLQDQQATGAKAHYFVSGSGKEATSTTRSVKIASGITVTMLAGDAGTPVNITVTRSTTALSKALSNLALAYNSAVDEVDKQHGESAGPLAGSPIMTDLSQTLRGLATYSSGGSIDGFRTLGLELGKDGHFTFSSFNLMAADLSDSAGVTAFFGSSSKSGFLKFATDSMNRVEASGTGMLAVMQVSLQSQITQIDGNIADKQFQVAQLKERLQQQMSAMDALVANMEQQYNYMYGMFQAMQTASSQYR